MKLLSFFTVKFLFKVDISEATSWFWPTFLILHKAIVALESFDVKSGEKVVIMELNKKWFKYTY